MSNKLLPYHIFLGFCPPPPDATIISYLNDRERGRHYLVWDFGAPQCPPTDATILSYLNDRERGSHYLLWDFGAPLPPLATPLSGAKYPIASVYLCNIIFIFLCKNMSIFREFFDTI